MAEQYRPWVLLTLILVGGCASPAPTLTPTPPSKPVVFDLTPRPMTVLPPGLVVPDGPPEGWTHLVVKSRSRVHSGDVERMSPELKHLASFLGSALVAKVVPSPSGKAPYRLTEVAFGISTKIGDRDTIISGAAQKKVGANLGFLEQLGLSRAEARLPGLLVAAHSDTMAVIDAPTQLDRNGKHELVVFRSVLLLDAATGKLDTWTWVVDKDDEGNLTKVSSDAAWSPSGITDEILLHVDGKEFVLGVITEKALATPHPPKGEKQAALPDDLKAAAASRPLTRPQFEALEAGLRKMLAAARPR